MSVSRRFLVGFWGVTWKEIEKQFSQQNKVIQNVLVKFSALTTYSTKCSLLKQTGRERKKVNFSTNNCFFSRERALIIPEDY